MNGERRRIFKLTRRELVLAVGAGALAGGAGLVLGFEYGTRRERWAKRVPPREQPFAPSVYLAIDDQGSVTVWVTKSEMGQGVRTALPMLVAEELDADWQRVGIEQAIANRRYGNQLTGNSASVRDLFGELRRTGASARHMLVAAAAEQWGVPASECHTEAGRVVHAASGKRIEYRLLVSRAAQLPVPSDPPLKDPRRFRLVGRSLPRLDTPDKVTGQARFGLDVRLPGLRYACVARCPIFGGRLKRFEAEPARSAWGVHDVFAIDGGVAIVADSSWAAFEARRQLQVEWEPGPHAALDGAAIERTLEQALSGPVASARREGDEAAWSRAARRVEARYAVPYLAHATMEPINATAHVREDRCDIWAPTQAPGGAQRIGSQLTGLSPADVVVHPTLLGGGFGRRAANLEVHDAVEVAKRIDGPVQVVWSREDDIRHDVYRSAALQALSAALDSEGWPVAWKHVIATPSMQSRSSAEQLDALMVSGAPELPYTFERVEVGWASAELPVPLGFWRSVAHSYTAYAIECFLDEVARAGGKDPLELRTKLLPEGSRHRRVLERAAEVARWSESPPDGVARGIAMHASFGSFVAMVAEVKRTAGRPRVTRVVAAVDCGQVVHPDIVAAQVEGGIVFGLTATLYGRIDIEQGRAVQGNFDSYRLVRIDEMPEVDVVLVDSDEPPGGVGEIAVPPIVPAVCNALVALDGGPIRELPLAGQ